MLVCDNCGGRFSNKVVIDGKARILHGRRRYCLNCCPFGRPNTVGLGLKPRQRQCAVCGADTANAQFCSNRCQQALRWQQRRQHIQETGIIPAGPSGHSRMAKRYLLETRGRACEICGGTEWRGQPIPLVLDHVDGNAENSAVANLRLVCGNCDMQLPTYKSRNRGRGRAWRRLRYANGQTY